MWIPRSSRHPKAWIRVSWTFLSGVLPSRGITDEKSVNIRMRFRVSRRKVGEWPLTCWEAGFRGNRIEWVGFWIGYVQGVLIGGQEIANCVFVSGGILGGRVMKCERLYDLSLSPRSRQPVYHVRSMRPLCYRVRSRISVRAQNRLRRIWQHLFLPVRRVGQIVGGAALSRYRIDWSVS